MKKSTQFVFNKGDINAISMVSVILKEIEHAEGFSGLLWTTEDLDFLIALAEKDLSDKERNCPLLNATRLLSSNFSIEQKGEKA